MKSTVRALQSTRRVLKSTRCALKSALGPLGLTLALLSVVSVCAAAPAAPASAARPTIVELYTSEGCSSCPPAEAMIEALAGREDVLPLAFHVDYWDGLGWRDRFGLKESAERQRELAAKLGLSTVGTPQMIVEGRKAVWGANRPELERALQTPRPPSPNISIALTGSGNALTVRLPAGPMCDACDVYLVGYLPRAVTPVARGENAGRTLTEVNIVRYIHKIGTTGAPASEWTVPLDSLPADASRIVVFLQSASSGAILGARTLERGAAGAGA